jgi:Zn finger protein HypA/HybF involved in hydrogenase expression
MAASAFCPTCQRHVYVRDGDTRICPVCSSPLLEVVDPEAVDPEGVPESDQMEGTK